MTARLTLLRKHKKPQCALHNMRSSCLMNLKDRPFLNTEAPICRLAIRSDQPTVINISDLTKRAKKLSKREDQNRLATSQLHKVSSSDNLISFVHAQINLAKLTQHYLGTRYHVSASKTPQTSYQGLIPVLICESETQILEPTDTRSKLDRIIQDAYLCKPKALFNAALLNSPDHQANPEIKPLVLENFMDFIDFIILQMLNERAKRIINPKLKPEDETETKLDQNARLLANYLSSTTHSYMSRTNRTELIHNSNQRLIDQLLKQNPRLKRILSFHFVLAKGFGFEYLSIKESKGRKAKSAAKSVQQAVKKIYQAKLDAQTKPKEALYLPLNINPPHREALCQNLTAQWLPYLVIHKRTI